MKSSLVGNCIDSCSQRALQVPAPGGVSRWGLAVGAAVPAFILRRATDRTPHGLPGTLHLLASPATCHCFNPEFSLIHFPPAQKIMLNVYSAGSKTPTSRGGNERLLAASARRAARRWEFPAPRRYYAGRPAPRRARASRIRTCLPRVPWCSKQIRRSAPCGFRLLASGSGLPPNAAPANAPDTMQPQESAPAELE